MKKSKKKSKVHGIISAVRPPDEGVELLNAVQEVYLSEEITIA